MDTFVSTDKVISLMAPEGVWEGATAANAEFESGTLLLLGRYLKEKDNQKNAHLQVFVPRLDPSVQRYVLQGIGQALFPYLIYPPWVPPAELERHHHHQDEAEPERGRVGEDEGQRHADAVEP